MANTTAIGGLMGGIMAGEEHAQQIRDQQQLARLREVEVASATSKLQQDMATTSALQRMFTGMNPAQQEQFQQLPESQQLSLMAKQLMAVNPKTGASLMSQANNARTRELGERRQGLLEQKERNDRLGSILSSADSADTYPDVMRQYFQEGGDIPSWYTGNYEQDKPKLQRQARAMMKQRDQLAAADRQTGLEIRMDDLLRKLQADQERASMDRERADLARERLEVLKQYREERLRQHDEDAARKQQGKGTGSKSIIPTSSETKLAAGVVSGREDLKSMDPSVKLRVANAVASRAKEKIVRGESEEDYESLIESELDNMVRKGELTPGKTGSIAGIPLPFGIGSSKPSFQRQAEKPAAPTPQDLQAQAKKLWPGDDPAKYDYRINPQTGKLQRALKE